MQSDLTAIHSPLICKKCTIDMSADSVSSISDCMDIVTLPVYMYCTCQISHVSNVGCGRIWIYIYILLHCQDRYFRMSDQQYQQQQEQKRMHEREQQLQMEERQRRDHHLPGPQYGPSTFRVRTF